MDLGEKTIQEKLSLRCSSSGGDAHWVSRNMEQRFAGEIDAGEAGVGVSAVVLGEAKEAEEILKDSTNAWPRLWIRRY